MPTFGFRGFSTASAVAITVAQGAASQSGNVAEWGTATSHENTAELDITAFFTETDDGGNVVSPGAVWLEVTGWTDWDSPGPQGTSNYDARLNDIEYYWQVSGPGDFAAHGAINLPDEGSWRDLSRQRGPLVCFPLSAAGTYTWTLFAVEVASGKTCLKTGSFATVSEDSAFPGTRTICYSAAGEFSQAPAGATTVTTESALQSAVAAAEAAGNAFRVLLRRGEAYACPDFGYASPPNYRIGAYGAGARPVLRRGNGSISPTGGDLKAFIRDIDMQGDWDAVNERGKSRGFPINLGRAQFQCTTYNIRSDGWTIGVPACDGDGQDIRVAHINFAATNFQSYGGLSGNPSTPTNYLAYIGCTVAWPSGAVDGVGATKASDNRTGTNECVGDLCNGLTGSSAPYGGGGGGWCLRITEFNKVVMQHCDLASAVAVADVNNQLYHVSPLRANTKDAAAALYNIAYSSFEGGVVSIATYNSSTNNNSLSEEFAGLLVDSCIFLSTPANSAFIDVAQVGHTIRNTYFLYGDAPTLTTRNLVFAVRSETNYPADNLNAPVKFYNNTALILKDNTTTVGNYDLDYTNSGWGGFTNTTLENNILKGPLQSLGAAGIDYQTDAIPGYAPRYAGYKPGFPIIAHTVPGTWANGGDISIGYPSGTDQGYWAALVGTDDLHAIRLSSGDVLHAQDGDFSVTFGASDITFTNLSGSGITGDIAIKLDRASRMSVDTAYRHSTPLHWCRIASGSENDFLVSGGLTSYRDIDGMERSTPAYQGAFEP